MDAPQPEIRIGDRERREIDERLRLALNDGVLTLSEFDERTGLCAAARTRAELDALVADLPPPHPPEQPTQKIATSAPAFTLDAPARKRLLTAAAGTVVLGVALIFGVPALSADDGMAVFGSRPVSVLDDTEVEVGVLFGSLDVIVPDDALVRTSGTIVFGSLDCDQACIPGPGQTREVVVNGSGAFGSVDVVRQSERNREIQEEIAEDQRDEEQDRND